MDKIKKDRRETKRTIKRSTTGKEVLFIFEKVIEGWTTIRIYNTLRQMDPLSQTEKKKVEKIATGNCKVYESELSHEEYEKYLELRKKVYDLLNKNNSKIII
jgi:hypothetical protein